jgi:hypothetical protein
MSNPISEEELAEADKLLAEVLTFHQYGAPAGLGFKQARDIIDTKIEHFLRRDEPESGYYERFGDHSLEG